MTGECPVGLACDPRTGRCCDADDPTCQTSGLDAGGCQSDDDCAPPMTICAQSACVPGCAAAGCTAPLQCDSTSGHCVALDCERDTDCDPDSTCTQAGQCVPLTQRGHSDCAGGTKVSYDCATQGSAASFASCTGPPGPDDCPYCIDDSCLAPGLCSSDGDCSRGLSCTEGLCIAEMPQCPSTQDLEDVVNGVYAAGKAVWKYGHSTRDGWALDNGNVLLALPKSRAHPHGGVVEVTRGNKVVFEFAGTQDEVNTVQPVDKGRYLLTEAGQKPRLLEVNKDGKVEVEVPLDAQTKDTHLQTRMARKLANGNYLVPQLLDKVVREYTPRGEVVWEFKTPDEPKEAWPFTAIRLGDGNTLITCTHGNIVIEADAAGKEVWRLTNADLPGPLLKDPCGAQRLANGNTVITSYGASGAGEVKMLEVTREKRLVWTYKSGVAGGVHEFQVLTTGGKAEGAVMK